MKNLFYLDSSIRLKSNIYRYRYPSEWTVPKNDDLHRIIEKCGKLSCKQYVPPEIPQIAYSNYRKPLNTLSHYTVSRHQRDGSGGCSYSHIYSLDCSGYTWLRPSTMTTIYLAVHWLCYQCFQPVDEEFYDMMNDIHTYNLAHYQSRFLNYNWVIETWQST